MTSKMIEIRDRGTFVPALATRLDTGLEHERWLLREAGFEAPHEYVLLCKITGGGGHMKATTDPFDWCDRTYFTVHKYLLEHFDEVRPGQVLDVEYILGEKPTPKQSERAARWLATKELEELV
jgi:hypothetical protein